MDSRTFVLTEPVDREIETHISRVKLTKHFAYKFKKPLALNFLDYSGYKERAGAALQELRLNRRLSEGVYLGVVFDTTVPYSLIEPMTELMPQSAECAVVMRRLDQRKLLSALLAEDAPQLPQLLRDIADTLVPFHRANRISLPAAEAAAEIRSLFEGNFTDLQAPELSSSLTLESRELLNETINLQRRELQRYISEIGLRIEGGYWVDGHGDLRAEHICIEPWGSSNSAVQIIDCVEFNQSIRRGDTASELAFLVMDLVRLRRPDLAEIFIERYQYRSSDGALEMLLPLFVSYRALVRAKVQAIREQQLGLESSAARRSDQYLSLAHASLGGLQRPLLIVVCGLSGSGKSTLARALADRLHAVHLSSDELRKEMFKETGGAANADYHTGIYTPEIIAAVYRRMFEAGELLLRRGNSVIFDATFLKRRLRGEARDCAVRAGCSCALLECQLEQDQLMQRITTRMLKGSSSSNARPEHLEKQLAEYERPESEGFEIQLQIEVNKPAALLAREAAKILKHFC